VTCIPPLSPQRNEIITNARFIWDAQAQVLNSAASNARQTLSPKSNYHCAAAERTKSRQKNGGKSVQLCSAAGAAAVGIPRSTRAIHAQCEVAARAAYNASLAIEAHDTGQTAAAAARCSSRSNRLIQRRVELVNTVLLLFKLLQFVKNVLVDPAVGPEPPRSSQRAGRGARRRQDAEKRSGRLVRSKQLRSRIKVTGEGVIVKRTGRMIT
jgi:hypothetical protein